MAMTFNQFIFRIDIIAILGGDLRRNG